jgi:putative transposase
MAQSLTNLLYHLVFSTKHRQPLIVPNLRPELYKYLGGIIRGEGGILLEIGGMPDHVHLVAKLKADVSVADMLRRIKANSSKWVNQQRKQRQRFSWQAGYGAFTVSQSQLTAVGKYVHTQEEHHRKKSFQEEFLQLLKKHHIEYDERYLWD